MRNRILTVLVISLLGLGAVACDDTSSGVQEDAQELEQGAENLGEEIVPDTAEGGVELEGEVDSGE